MSFTKCQIWNTNLLLKVIQAKIWSEVHNKNLLMTVMFYRQHSWDWNQEKWLQQKAARAVLSSNSNWRQQLPCPEQHKHFDHPCLQMWFWWHHPVLQCGSNLLTSWPQHRSFDCNLVVYCYTSRLVLMKPCKVLYSDYSLSSPSFNKSHGKCVAVYF